MQKILMIVYHFWPDQEVGAVRSIKFAKYLPQFGWKPYILTVKVGSIPKIDMSGNGPDCEIIRTLKLPTLNDIYLGFKNVLVRQKPKGAHTAKAIQNISQAAGESLIHDKASWKRFIDSLSTTPDDKIGWLLPGAARAIGIIRKQNIDVIYSSGPPHTCHLIGLIAKKFTGKKWIVDYRDPWTTGVRIGQSFGGLGSRLEKSMESAVLSKVDHVITATPAIDEQLRQIIPNISKKSTTIFNGYDDEDFIGINRHQRTKEEPVKFLHAGTLYMGRDPSLFIEAIAELIADGSISKKDLRIEFLGSNEINGSLFERSILNLNLSDIIRFIASIPKEEYFSAISNADVLLLMQSELASPQIPGKTFDYLATGNRILALVPPGATSDLLGEFDHIKIADPRDKDQIKSCILELMRELTGAFVKLKADYRKPEEFSRKTHTRELVSILNSMIKKL